MSGRDESLHAPDAGPLGRAPGPSIRSLSHLECEAVLARHCVARVAHAFDRQVSILPIHYVFDDGWLYGRTSFSTKVTLWQHSHWVAAEVDEVRSLFDWESVVVRGALYLLSPDDTEVNAAVWEHAVELLRRLVPDTGTAFDPLPQRTVLFRIHADEVTGRECRPGPPPA